MLQYRCGDHPPPQPPGSWNEPEHKPENPHKPEDEGDEEEKPKSA